MVEHENTGAHRMPPDYTFTIEDADGIAVVRFQSAPGVGELCAVLDELERRDASPLRLYDMSHGLRLGRSELKRVAQHAATKRSQPTRVATVLRDTQARGLTRMYGAYRVPGPLQYRMFDDETSARAWLRGTDGDS